MEAIRIPSESEYGVCRYNPKIIAPRGEWTLEEIVADGGFGAVMAV